MIGSRITRPRRMRCNHGSPTQVPGGPVLPVVLVHGAVRPVRRSSWHYEKPRAGEFRLPAARTQTPPKAGLLTSPEESQADLLRLPKFERIAREKLVSCSINFAGQSCHPCISRLFGGTLRLSQSTQGGIRRTSAWRNLVLCP